MKCQPFPSRSSQGLDKIGAIPPGWRVAELAPLSVDQQRKLAEVWFNKTAGRAPAEQGIEVIGPVEARLDRFFMELARDRRLSTLAGNPLLLVGLIALSMRQVALPRNRTQAVESLVSILAETHPERRATEAGDTRARFASIPDAEDRRAALARLAFVARSATGGGTYDIKEARKTIREYLADPNTLGYPADRAQRAAAEMLAVNAETVGLLAERAPGEVGFAHAGDSRSSTHRTCAGMTPVHEIYFVCQGQVRGAALAQRHLASGFAP